MFLQVSVCPQGGVCLSACWDTRPPRTRQTTNPPDQADPPGPCRHPPPWTRQTSPGPGRQPLDHAHTPRTSRQTPQPGRAPRPGRPPRTRQTPPLGPAGRPLLGSRVQHTVYERPVRILLECILVTIFNFSIINGYSLLCLCYLFFCLYLYHSLYFSLL